MAEPKVVNIVRCMDKIGFPDWSRMFENAPKFSARFLQQSQQRETDFDVADLNCIICSLHIILKCLLVDER